MRGLISWPGSVCRCEVAEQLLDSNRACKLAGLSIRSVVGCIFVIFNRSKKLFLPLSNLYATLS